MKRIVIATTTRAEYGLLRPVIQKMDTRAEIDLKLVVSGTHLSKAHGMTVAEIENDGVRIDKMIDIALKGDRPSDISKYMGYTITEFAEYFDECRPDALLVLGDRYEIMAICIAATNARIPIIHLHGGETTEGAVDEVMRHAITKMSHLHFTSTEVYRNRVIQMGELPERVYNVGALGVENVLNMKLLSFEELRTGLGCSLKREYAVLTFHPVTLENDTAEQQIMELLYAIDMFPQIDFICTKANADAGSGIINDKLEEYAINHNNVHLFDSLGSLRYLSSLKNAKFVIGNSSSGIIEAPSFHIPTINIGNRQRGRIRSESVIDCLPKRGSIEKAITLALSNSFVSVVSDALNPYEKSGTSDAIVDTTIRHLLDNGFGVEKKFYNLC